MTVKCKLITLMSYFVVASVQIRACEQKKNNENLEERGNDHDDADHSDKSTDDQYNMITISPFFNIDCRGITRIHRSPSRPRPSMRPTAAFINIHEHLI